MSTERRVENLLRAAERAEREGNRYLATILRKMAQELGPPDAGASSEKLPSASR